MATLTVGVGEQYATIAAAVSATQDGDTVLVNAGTYTNDFVTISHAITLKSVGGQATMVATESPPNGKAIMTVDNSAVIDGFGFTGAVVGDNNGAGIRYEGGNLVVRNSVFWDNQDGLLANPNSAGTILIQNSEFSHNGAGDGYSHNIYVGAIASLTIEDSYFHDAVVGHEIKSRAYNTTIINSRIEDNQGNASYGIDLPNGGNAVIEGNTIEKGPNAENYTTIAYGEEGSVYAGSSLTVSGNTLVSDNPNGVLLNNRTSIPATLSNNQIWGFGAGSIAGPVTQTANTTLSSRPVLDTSTMAPAVVVAPPPPPVILVPGNTQLETWGTAGAVVATGHILTVGAHGEFGSLTSALAASADGDTIEVAAGTYTNDFGSVNHKVIIEGVGGIAKFVQTGTNGQTGILTVNADVTLENLEFSGASNYDGNEGGVTVLGGNVTVVNSLFVGNDTSIRAVTNAAETLSIFNSEFSGNGNQYKGTNGMVIDPIASFTMQGSYVHDVVTGHEISDHAFNSDIENNRIMDGPTAPASDLIDLGQGGFAIIKGNVLEKGLDAQSDLLINVGGEGTTYSNSNVQITGNTLVSDMVNPAHPYTFFIVGENVGTLPPITATGNVFVGGVPGSQQVINATASNNTVAASATLDTSSPVSAAAAPALFATTAKGADTLTLSLTEVATDVNAQFELLVDGTAVGGGQVTAADGTTPELFTFTGNWGPGAHTVDVKSLNLNAHSSTGTSATFLDVKGISIDSTSVAPYVALNANTQDYSTSITVPAAAAGVNTTAAPASSLVLHLSEDAYQGDAQFSVSVDGVTLGSPQNVTALHNQGQSEAFTYTGAWTTGAHNVAVSFLNDAYGGGSNDRNLYVNSIDMNGIANTTATAALYNNGTVNMNVVAGAPAAVATTPTDTLVLHLSEDAYLGDAQFIVAVDGKQLGLAQSVSALHGLGQTQDFTLTGAFGAGPHDLALTFLNDAYGGSGPGLDRNLYMNGATIDGQTVSGATMPLYSAGTGHVQFIVPQS